MKTFTKSELNYKMIAILTLIPILIFSTNLLGQLPIGRNKNIGKSEVVSLFKANGFHYLKESVENLYSYNRETKKWDTPDGEYISILFKEEITVNIFYNKYQNITSIAIDFENIRNKNKILSFLKFSKWKLIRVNEKYNEYFYNCNNNFCMISDIQIIVKSTEFRLD